MQPLNVYPLESVSQELIRDHVAGVDTSRIARRAYQEAFLRYVHRPLDADEAALRQAMETARHRWEAARGLAYPC
jgi:hypothetical protein